MDGADAVDGKAEGADNAPAARHDAQRDGRGAGEHDPERHLEGRDEAAEEQNQGQDAHAFLGVVGAVREGQAGGGDVLQAAQPGIGGRVGGDEQGAEQAVDQKADPETNEWREDERGEDLDDAGQMSVGQFGKAPGDMIGADGDDDGADQPANQGVRGR